MQINDLGDTTEISPPLGDPDSNPAGGRAHTAPARPVKDRPVFILKLRPEPHVVDPVKALRGFLKDALRRWGLRAISAIEEKNNDL
jgi:hypothetical protein